MRTLAQIEAYTVEFPRGGTPYVCPAILTIVEANGRNFLRTPSAMLDHHAPTIQEA